METDLRRDGMQAILGDESVGSLAKYRRLVVGDTGAWGFLRYETVTSLFGQWPGAAGLLLRRLFYPGLFRTCGRNVIFGRGITVRHPHRISIGSGVVIGDNATLDAKGTEGDGILIRDGVYIGTGTVVTTSDGTMELDEGCNIGSYCRLGAYGSTRIGRKALLAAFCYVVGASHRSDRLDIPILDQPNETKGGSEVGDGCWLGTKVTVMDGVRVGRDSIVGAHSLVTRDLPELCVAMGVPARVARMRNGAPVPPNE
jgi:acetyltransferase-like isoleucine patch superfamily enzyme